MRSQSISSSGNTGGVGTIPSLVEPTSSILVNDLIRHLMEENDSACRQILSLPEASRTGFLFSSLRGNGTNKKMSSSLMLEIISLSNDKFLRMDRLTALHAISRGPLGEEVIPDLATYFLARIIHLYIAPPRS